MATLLFLGASVSQLPAIRFAKARGHTVVACDGDPNAVAFPLCDVAAVVDFSDVDRVSEVAARERVEGVLAVCTDRAVVPAARVAERLGLPGLGEAVAHAMSHKPTMRQRLAQCQVGQPWHRVLTAETDLEMLPRVPLPAVLKPADSGGQRGLTKVERFEEIKAALPVALAASRSGEAMLEEYVEGLEVNTLFAVRGGEPTLLTISDRLRPGGAGFGVGWIHLYPTSLRGKELATAADTAAAAVRCLGMQDGIAFPQILVSERGAVVVEVAARIAAGQMADLVLHATGIELYEIAIRQALGKPVPDDIVTARSDRPVAIRFLTATPGVLPLGTVRSISGLEKVRNEPGILDAGLYFREGTTIGPLQVDADRRGYVIATGDTPRDALDRADTAARKLRVEVENVKGRQRSVSRERILAPVAVTLLLAATAVTFALTETAKLQHALILGTRVDKTFSPICGCNQDVAHIVFRLSRRAVVAVSIVTPAGVRVATLLTQRTLAAQLVKLAWHGRTSSDQIAANGTYYPDVSFPRLSRTLRLPSAIVLDYDRPRIDSATERRQGAGLSVRYDFSEPAHALLVVGGHRAVLTRASPTSGTLRWSGTFASGSRARLNETLALIAIDQAGNASQPDRLGRLASARHS